MLNACRTTKRCQTCKKQHHTTLHRGNIAPASTPSPSQQNPTPVATSISPSLPPAQPRREELASTSAHASSRVSQNNLTRRGPVLLATATVNVISRRGEHIQARALIDQGSEVSFATESLAQRLNLTRRSASVPIIGIGAQRSAVARGSTIIRIVSRLNPSFSREIDVLILPKLTAFLPSFQVQDGNWPHIQGLNLADSDFGTPRHIDLVLGADFHSQILEEGIRYGDPGTPTAQRTTLGWILSGPIPSEATVPPMNGERAIQGFQCSPDYELLEVMQRFWAQEDSAAADPQLNSDESQCQEHFRSTHSRDSEGRYIVRLPLKNLPEDLGNSRGPALRMLSRMETRFESNAPLKTAYSFFLREYRELGHMRRAPGPSGDSSRRAFYLPHHGVIRESSSTTKLRVVFNGSQKTNLGKSLNDFLHIGPKLHTELADILQRWRRHPYVFSADIEKMFRQIRVHPDDWDLQRILWRDAPTVPPEEYQLCTVTYGLACAPYLALRTLQQLTQDEGERFPQAAEILRRDTYVDDIFSGANDVTSGKNQIKQLEQLLMAGGFTLQKWTASHDELLRDISPNRREKASTRQLEDTPSFRTLGLTWQPHNDSFVFIAQQAAANSRTTKRNVLSRIAQLFDPLGWLAPVVIQAKIFMQELWAVRLDWDDELPPPLATRWDNFLQQLQDTNTFSIPRWLGLQPSAIAVELHGFADASQAALAAVIYLRVCSDLDDIRVTIVAAKTKVAPLKPVTIPRLELAAALLLVRQISHIRKTLDLESAPIHLWTDSTVALAWIKSHPSLRKDFVRNRVAEIQELSTARWHHVAGRENPADCASRGLTPQQLQKHKLWWSGPKWLQKHSTSWPSANPSPPLDADLEERTKIVTTHGKEDVILWDLVDRFSMLTKLIRITAWCMRVVPQSPRVHPRTSSQPPLSPTELDTARLFWVKSTQKAYFRTEIELLKSGKQLPRSHPLLRLSPFVDAASLLRVGGSLRHSQLDPDEKHPLILPRDSAFTTLILDHYHRRTLHGGTQLTLSTLRQRYWILGGRVPVRAFIHRCVPCVRQRALTGQQLMGQLPEARVSQSRPFLNSGVDYAGPITLKTFSGRGTKTYKSYIAIFVCLASSAIHLEVVTDYATSGFIAAYKRFTGRRGICATIRSDCGTNLIGADAELRKMFTASSKEWAHIANLLANDGTKWRFNPPSAPHFGGKWETGVKSVKFHLKRVIGDALLTYEEMSTFLAQVEAVLNSRPLCPLSDDPSDLSTLTPGHLLIGSALTTIPEPTLLDVPTSRLSQWQLFRQMTEKFWLRWSAEYLQHLQSLTKWQLQQDSLKIGSLVLVKDERLPPSKWALARVTDVHPGADNLVRVVTVKTQSSVFKRPVVKLCLLPVSAAS